MRISCDVDDPNKSYGSNQILFTYSPQTTVGTTTVGLDIGAELGYSGGFTGSVNVGSNWSYSYSDVTVRNNSDIGLNDFNVWHDINECTNSGYDPVMVEPGIVIRVGSNLGECHNYDHYKVQFCKVVLHGTWHNSFTDFE